ncbi:TPA: tyrosine-type recombinase/integrase [Pseudomonas putida]
MEQLWISASENFRMPGFSKYANGGRWSAGKLRALYWPSGDICWQINMYLISCRRGGLEVSTVNTYCSELSSFVRFLDSEQLALFDVVDDNLEDFADWLPTVRKITGNHINRLILRVISFYRWAQGAIHQDKIVGVSTDKCAITVMVDRVKLPGGRVRTRVRHRAMVPSNVTRTVHPMALGILKKLMEANSNLSKSGFVRKRNQMMLTVLADTGIRREELVSITVDSILESRKTGMLKVFTSKRKGNPSRLVPLPENTADALVGYVETSRRILMRKLEKKNAGFIDPKWAFCTRRGQILAPATITQLFSDLRAEAGVTVSATAHMLRHRFITLQLVVRLRMLSQKRSIGVELLTTILSKLASITGHSSIESLWQYVDWAYDEIEQGGNGEPIELKQTIKIVSSMLSEAENDGDKRLASDLHKVLEALSLSPVQAVRYPSIVSHSLRGRGTG